MVDEAPPAEATLPELADLLEGRVLVAHSASFDRRVLEQAFERAGVDWPDPPVICTIALARRLHPLARQRKLALLAGSLGIEVETVAPRARRRRDLRARLLCAVPAARWPTRRRSAARSSCSRPPRRARRRAGATDGGGARPRRAAPASGPQRPRRLARCLRRPQRGRAGALRRQVDASAHARARTLRAVLAVRRAGPHAPRPSSTTATASELGALVLEQRLVDELRPPGNAKLKSADELVLAALPAGHRVPGARGRARAGAGARRQHRAAARAGDRRPSSASSSPRCSACATAAGVCSCAPHPSAFGQMGRCLSPCLGDLDPNLYRAPGRRRAGAVPPPRPAPRAAARTSTS